ncbi:hypothetical protein [Novosphingobium mangrovi (ex Huang et al. 2023)]|uniref:Lipoprotein n=1 Tax=Novosphingobium mangrovi (ex Huang et al. 2023) TaxID=2976432 RepID=A0ABT2HZY1_9SPHN|nr:hypothetical protein [Novosphingobium mangrovi (ex Huang et al. 2023)]MCT2398099.1 hypothetical protein [Novosphingobium mangrovi (ex Huang et al. 2023)]
MKTAYLPLVLTSLALAACSQGEPRKAPPVTPAAEAIGPARDCLPITQFSNTRIRDDWTIDFIGGAGSKVWRVTLPNRCNGLKSADSFTYETSLSQLCKHDIIYPLLQYGGRPQRGAGCGMGPFVPVKLKR